MPTGEYGAKIIWSILVDAAGQHRTVTYGQLAPQVDTIPLGVARFLGPIQDYCLQNRLPPLTAIVVRANDNTPGTGFIAWDVDDLPTAQNIVFQEDWSRHPNPFEIFENRDDSVDTIANSLVNDPEQAGDVYRQVRDRGIAQLIFRKTLMRAYNESCAFCGCTFEFTLQAAHIRRWGEATPVQRIHPNNGVLLCANHHAMFDADFITIDDQYTIRYRDPQMENYAPYNESDIAMSVNLDGRRMALPTDTRLWPSMDRVRERNQGFDWFGE